MPDIRDIEDCLLPGMVTVRATVAVPADGGDLAFEVGRCLQEMGAMLVSGDKAIGGVTVGADDRDTQDADGMVFGMDAIRGAKVAIRKL